MEHERFTPCELLIDIPCYTPEASAVDARDCNRVVCALAQLNQHNLTLSSLLGHLPGMAFRRALPIPGKFEYVSAGCLDITGIAAERLCTDATLWEDSIHTDFREGVKAIIERAIAQHHPYLAIYKIHDARGNEAWVWEQGKAIYASTGEPQALEGYVASLTATPNGQLDAALLNEQLSQIVHNSDHAFWITSIKNNQIVYISPAFEEIWGIERSLLLENPALWLDAVEPRHRRNVELAQAVDFNYYGKKTVTIEYQIRRPDGEERWVRARFSPLFDREGNCLGRGGTATDITEEKRLAQLCESANRKLEEDLQRRQQQLEILAREKSQLDKLAATAQMAAGIAHEINNPLAGIKNAVTLMKSAIPSEHPYQRYASMAERELERLAAITRQMYQLYQPNREPYRTIQLDRLVEDTLALCHPELKLRNLRTHVQYDPQQIRLNLPESDIRQMLMNIVRNAIDASPQGADIHLRCRHHQNTLQMAVHNTGTAIAPGLKEKIFEPFFTTKNGKDKGMGLGLTVSHSLATQHGGEIRVESSEQETVFTIVLPV